MIDDALAGKIDLIVTKSVSRFARNTVDSLTTIRKLKENSISDISDRSRTRDQNHPLFDTNISSFNIVEHKLNRFRLTIQHL